MKIVVMGTGNFAVPAFEKLIRSGHSIPTLVTMPIRTRKKDRIPPPAIRRVAEENGIPIFDPENVNDAEAVAFLKTLDAEMIFICDYGKILSPEVIGLYPYGGVNLHGSVLPKFRGAAPINRAILAGETRLGVSLIHITPKVDAGPVIAVESYEPDEKETAPAVEAYLADLGGNLLVATMETIRRREDRAVPQNGEEATPAPKIRKEEGRIDWTASVRRIRDQYRALQPWPKTFSDWCRSAEKADSEKETPAVRLILGPLEIAEEFGTDAVSDPDVLCGTVVAADKENGILVRAGDGRIRILGVQPAGKREMAVIPFLSGYRMKVGDRLF